MKARTFVDSCILYAAGGRGGNGCVSFRREKYVAFGGPNGGDGGRGGHVILQADRDTDSLISLYFTPHLRGAPGQHGMGKEMYGRQGKDVVAKVPCGTQVYDEASGVLLAELLDHGGQHIIARGGRGGLGNCHWKTSTHQAPREHTDGDPGQELTLRLELKLVADAGLVGFPNAGKSSLLRCVSDAHPKVAAYPFTTLNPIIGTLKFEDYSSMRLADIPGLIEGAHDGVGLGFRFLRHVERSLFLVFVLDMAGSEDRDPVKDYEDLRRELTLYKEELAERPFIVVANKMDLPEAAQKLKAFKKATKCKPLPVSALSGDGIPELRERIREMYVKYRKTA